jgi:hypothetical protein
VSGEKGGLKNTDLKIAPRIIFPVN